MACSSTPNATARIANSTIVSGTNVPAKLPNARSVHTPGKSVTDSSPMTTNARPRNSASVPIVTASDGRPKRVTSTPLNAPHSAPATRQSGMISSTGSPWFHSDAAIALDSASTEATERSISAAMITSVSGSAISATSEKSSEPVVKESVVRNSDDRLWPATTVSRMSPISSVSQRPANARRRAPDAARAGSGSGRLSLHGARSSGAGRPRRAGRGSGRTRSRSAAARRSRPAARTPRRAGRSATSVIVPSSSAPSAAP